MTPKTLLSLAPVVCSIGAVVCFCLGKDAAAVMLLAATGLHLAPSPLSQTNPTPSLERVENEEKGNI